MRIENRDPATAAFLVAVGISAWLHWSITDPSFDVSADQSEWPHVLGFSGLILALAGGAAALARVVSSAEPVRRIATVILVVGVLQSITNIVEDGVGIGQLFVVFALLTGVELLALIALSGAMAYLVSGPRRILALAPLGSAVGVIAYVNAGGLVLLATWTAAAILLVVTNRGATAPSAPA